MNQVSMMYCTNSKCPGPALRILGGVWPWPDSLKALKLSIKSLILLRRFVIKLNFWIIKSSMENNVPEHTCYTEALVVILVMMSHMIRFHHVDDIEFANSVMEKVMTKIVGNIRSHNTGVKRIQVLLASNRSD